MKNSILLLFIIALGFSIKSTGQNIFPATGSAGIGTSTPVSSAILELSSTSQGMLAPRMTKAQRDAIGSPAAGLLIYQTNSQPGFYYYSGAAWTALAGKGPNKQLSNLSATSINESLIPNANNTIDIGAVGLNWNEVYVNSIKFMDGTTQSSASAGGGGAETDPQVGTNTTNKVSKWDGSALVTGSINDENSRIGMGDINTNAKATFRNRLSLFSTEDMAVYATDQTVSAGGTVTTHATSILGYNSSGLLFFDTPVSHVGNWSSATTTTNSAAVYATNSSSGTSNYGVIAKSTGVGTTNYGLWAKATGATNNYAIIVPDDGGKVGIGTESPSAKLHTNSVTGESSFVAGVNGVKKFIVGSNGGISMFTSGSAPINGLYINGVTGMGTSSPDSRLHINSSSGEDAMRVQVNGSTKLHVNSNGGIAMFSTSTPPANGLYINGNTGIGISAPSVKLHVSGGSDAELGSGGYFIIGSTTSTNIVMDNNEIQGRDNGAVSKLYFNYEGGDIAMGVLGGNVTIGTNTAASGYKLSVDGKVMCEELKVQLSGSWPDYVFNEDYKLMPLNELENFISANNHLPNIPAASEIETNGLEVGEMQKLMMEKMEEFTLYLIEMKKENDGLKAEIELLKK
ncbi:MAG: hypothetical protein KBF51_12430 [Chitinophagales bacterium]|nr:hypothetical protein [Chitinophagales bacterium]MBP9190336.1 hypothetical protein [Chitinophagales bacterium]MBP9548821.1 hypothetical protein [Chitinophagales bacterium]